MAERTAWHWESETVLFNTPQDWNLCLRFDPESSGKDVTLVVNDMECLGG